MPARSRPYLVGLTGTVAAGKSVVGRRFEALGAVRVDADELAREAVRPGSAALEEIRSIWGDAVLAADGTLDRAGMRKRVFEDDEARVRLESIVHRAIATLRADRVAEASIAGARLIVEEIPLLFETRGGGRYDAIVVVDAPASMRAERARVSRGWTDAEFRAIDGAQLSGVEKRARADYVIENGGSLDALERQADQIWAALEAEAQRTVRTDATVDDPEPST